MKGLLFLSLSLLCILYLHFCKQGTCFLFFFIFFPRTDFCLETSAILFSLVETVHAILKDQLKYNFQKISAS